MIPLVDHASLDATTRARLTAVWSRKPTDHELLDARLARGWKPTPSGLKGGDRVLGYAACIFDEPGEQHHTHEHR